MMTQKIINIKEVNIGNDLPFTLIAGPCQLETEEHAMMIASQLADTATVLALLCFAGAIEWNKFGILLLNGFLFKVLMALIDTPILYLATAIIRNKFNLKFGEELKF